MTTGPLLGIDYGHRRIGVAISDGEGISTTPLGFIAREDDRQAAEVVLALAAQHQVTAIIIGKPLNANGSLSKAATLAKQFASRLRRVGPVPVYSVDERYSSEEAADILRQSGQQAAPGQLDAQAAAIILRRYLDDQRT